MNVTASASRPRTRTGPPFERLYAVEPDGVEQIMPSHGIVPRSSPPTAHASSIMRPSVALVATTSFTATCRSPFRSRRSVGSSRIVYSPASTRPRSRSRFAGSIDARKPTRPKLTPITGTSLPSSFVSVRRIVPSPPSAITRSASRGSSTTDAPARSASERTMSSAALTSTRPCVMTATALTGRDRCVDSLVEVIREGRLVGLQEMEEKLPVALRPGETRVYDGEDARPPRQRFLGDLSGDPGANCGAADAAPLADIRSACLELRLHEDHRLPARSRKLEQRRQCLPNRDERDVADDELRCERELADVARVGFLHDDHARVAPQAFVELVRPDVERDHSRSAALQEDVGEAAGGRADVEAVETGGVDVQTVEAVRELLAATGDVLRAAVHAQLGAFVDLLAGLVVARDAAGHDERLRLRARFRQTTLDERNVDAFLHAIAAATRSAMCTNGSGTGPRRTKAGSRGTRPRSSISPQTERRPAPRGA